MTELASVDHAGRVVLPKKVRDDMGVDDQTKFLVLVAEHGRLVLQKWDAASIAGRLEKELGGKDVDAIVRRVRREVRALSRRQDQAGPRAVDPSHPV